MGRVKVSVIIYITIAVLLLLLLSHTPKKPATSRHRRLTLRNFTNPDPHHHHHRHHEPVAFDPLVADIERRREDNQWEKRYFESAHPDIVKHVDESAQGHESRTEWEDFMDAEDYLNDEEKFNVTDRLLLLFPKIDVDPVDGYVNEHELTEWNLNQAEREVMHRTQREMDLHDKNHDGFVSFTEYDPPSWFKNSDSNPFGHDMGWWSEEHFNASDGDGDGVLNIAEFNDFLHPADSKNPKLLQWLCKEEIREKDLDKDGRMNFDEFFHGLFDLVSNYDEDGHYPSHTYHDSREAPAKILFTQLDKDGDGYLVDIELLPIIGQVHPPEQYYAKQQADYIISQADTDKDGRLSLKEIINNPYVFYSAVFSDEDETDYDFHDEFR